VGKWTDRLRAQHETTDKTDKTPLDEGDTGVLSVLSVDPGAENPRQESFVSFVGESGEGAGGPTRRPVGDGATPPASDVRPGSTDKTDKTHRSRAALDPGARCERHRRLLTFAEQLFGTCSWCVYETREVSQRRGPR
jgi:hypothetical protein